ncbi:4a-hydroxytetrahydrobiopterin dehydratase [Thiocystis minor]|uniref:4a-hydroxytetrahydrobiopterin dehydratase n=1 Tax=Thiocystis minor TaxID=61597 RepID=UPI0019121FF8|nr:4a-hydroxytetrahydrobiopterin dehydratase [Thiocystis minor]MBK5964495.1 4a-hydroxytetrahydrobiopterin dehydratase [Thiocystis minor]
MSDIRVYGEAEIRERIARELPRWIFEDGCLRRTYRTHGWKGTLMALNAVGHLAEAAWHHPDLTVSYDRVTISLMTHSAKGVTDKDFELASQIEDMVMWRPPAGSALEGTPDDVRFAYIRDE